jgi:DNA-binding MarR family transcriptional regulator
MSSTQQTVKNSPTLEKSYLALIEFLMLTKRHIIEHGSNYDLTSMQAMTLFMLDRPRPMNNFKKTFNCDASNVTGIVDGLEEKHLAARFEDPNDRRIKMVQLSRKGAAVRTTLLNEVTGPDSYILSKLTSEEVQTFIHLVEKITAE